MSAKAKVAAAYRSKVPKVKRTSSRELPERSKELLLQWCHDHIDHPYPSAEEKVDLGEETDLTLTQLSNWFTNWRKRVWNVQLPR